MIRRERTEACTVAAFLAIALCTACNSPAERANEGVICGAVDGGGDQAAESGAAGAGGSADAAEERDAVAETGAAGTGGSSGLTTDCAKPEVLCVDDTPGATQEYETIQAAADVDAVDVTVKVFEGTYAGFRTIGYKDFVAQGPNVFIDAPGSAGNGIWVEGVSTRIEGFRIRNMPTTCLVVWGGYDSVVIRNNVCEAPGRGGFLVAEGQFARIEGNEVVGAGVSGVPASHCMSIIGPFSDFIVVRGNILRGCTSSQSHGLMVSGDLTMGQDGILKGATISGNIIYGNAGNGLDLDGVQESLIENNLVWGNDGHALRARKFDGATGPGYLHLVNNTLVAGTSGWAVLLSDDLGGHVIFNNVLLGVDGALSIGGAPAAMNSDDNVLSDGFSVGGGAVMTLAQWQSLGYDANSLIATAEELFASPSAGDFHAQAGAAVVDTGVPKYMNVEAPAEDVFGTSRPQGIGIDIGAVEQ
jgi:hypothetical protein